MRDLLELLNARGWPCGVFCGAQLDFEDSPPLEQLLSDAGVQFTLRATPMGATPCSVLHLVQRGVPVTIYSSPSAHSGPELARIDGELFLRLFEEVLNRFQPDLVLTYGGHWLGREVIAKAKRHRLAVVFALRNFTYHDASLFEAADAVLVPSRFAQAHYQDTLGIKCTAIPGLCDWARIECPQVEGRYVTFVNPQPEKGLFVFARVAHQMQRLRPDIPLLVVEGRAKAARLASTGLDLSHLSNLFFMRNTADARDFYRVSRLVLMPSLWRESFGRVAVEALINGIPVLASRRGALPETLEDAGFLFDVPERYTPESTAVPTAEEVAPWVDTIIRLWDDTVFYEAESRRCRLAAEKWRPERLLPLYEQFFAGVFKEATSGRS